jgi:hypothetical protein
LDPVDAVVLGYYTPQKMKILGLNGPGSWWVPDTGYRFVQLVVRLSDTCPHLRCSIDDDVLVLGDGRIVEPTGFSMGKFITSNLETVISAPLIHLEFSGPHNLILYGILFSVPAGEVQLKARLRGKTEVDIKRLDDLPKELGLTKGDLMIRESISIPRFLPLARRVDPPTNLLHIPTPAETLGLIESGIIGEYAIFVIRAAFGEIAKSFQLTARDIRAQMVDSSWINALGVVDWVSVNDPNFPDAPAILDNITYMSGNKTIQPGCRFTFLHQYAGPITGVCWNEAKLVIAFHAASAASIRLIEISDLGFLVKP